MESRLRDERIRTVGATVGVVGALALAYQYLLIPALTVPYPAAYAFHIAWGVLVVLSIWWWRRHPWRSFLVPIVGLLVVMPILWFGGAYLGWTA